MNNYQQDHRHMGVMPGPALSPLLLPPLSTLSSGSEGWDSWRAGVCFWAELRRLRRAQARTQHSHNKLAKGPTRKRAEGMLQERLSKDGPHLRSHELTFSLCIPRPASTGTLISSLPEICTSLLASIHTPCPLPLPLLEAALQPPTLRCSAQTFKA